MLDRALQEVADISLLEGYRGEVSQNAAFASGASQLRWPDGKHNRYPSVAVDIQPYPRPKSKEKMWAALGYIAGRIVQIGIEEGVDIRWGGDWDGDGDMTDQDFMDLFHIEIRQ